MKTFTLDDLPDEQVHRLMYGPEPAAYLHRASVFQDAVVDEFYASEEAKGAKICWSKIEGAFKLRRSELTVWAGYNGSGKSLLTGQVMLGLMAQDCRVCVCSLEMPVRKTLARMVRQSWTKSEPPRPYIQAWHTWTDDRLWVYNYVGNLTLDEIAAIIRYSVEAFGIQHFVLDSLMMISTVNVTDYDVQKQVVNMLSRLARETGCHIHLVCHARKGTSEGQEIDRMSVKGASEITDQADNVVLLWKNPKPQESDPTHVLTVAKQRHEAWEGKLAMDFHQQSTQFIAHAGPDWAMDLVPDIEWQKAGYQPGTDEPVVWGEREAG